MIEVWKETLLPGTMVDPKTKRQFTVTPEEVATGHKNLKRMYSKGLNVPSIWEHLDVEENDDEEWKANYARNTFGRVGDSKISKVRDVEAGIASRPGTLLVRFDVHDEKDAEQLKKTGFVSPKIYKSGYLDSQGEEYEGLTVAHIAASPTVVQWWQKPFKMSQDETLYLSCIVPKEPEVSRSSDDTSTRYEDWLAALDQLYPDDALTLSAIEEEEEEEEEEEPDDSDLEDEDADDEDEDTDDDDLDLDEDEDMADEPEVKKKDSGDKGGGNADLKAVVEAIKSAYPNAKISDKVTNWSELVIALESQAGAGGDVMPEPEPEPEPAPEGEETAPAGAPPMMMSTTDRDPRKKQLAEKYAKPERDEAKTRVEKLFKTQRIDGPTRRKMLRQVEGVEMSFTADYEPSGKRWVKLLTDITEAEKKAEKSALPSGAFDLSATDTVNRPDLSGDKSKSTRGVDVILGVKSAQDIK